MNDRDFTEGNSKVIEIIFPLFLEKKNESSVVHGGQNGSWTLLIFFQKSHNWNVLLMWNLHNAMLMIPLIYEKLKHCSSGETGRDKP